MIAWRASQELLNSWLPGFTSCPQRLNVNSKLGHPLYLKTFYLSLYLCKKGDPNVLPANHGYSLSIRIFLIDCSSAMSIKTAPINLKADCVLGKIRITCSLLLTSWFSRSNEFVLRINW